MVDIIGVLGSATTATAATTTAYTVPTNKAARVKIFFQVQGAADATTDFLITVNGIVIGNILNIAASRYLWSTADFLFNTASVALPTGLSVAEVNSPAPTEYFLSAADVISYTIAGTTALSANVQVVGTEIDVV